MIRIDHGFGAIGLLFLALILGLLLSAIPPWETSVYGSVAQIFTAIIAFFAILVAAYSIHAQQQVARRRAALDFFLKTETDDKMIDRYNEYVKALPGIPVVASAMDEFRKSNTESYHQIRSYLNILELMALGVRTNALSDVVCREYWGDFVCQAVRDCRLIIDYMRGFEGSEEAYSALIAVEAVWRSERIKKGTHKDV